MSKIRLNVCEFVFGRVGFLEERPGVKSSMRLFSFILLCFFVYFNLFYIQHHDINETLCWFDGVILVGVFAPKTLQKLLELKMGNMVTTETTQQLIAKETTTENKA
jgi:hypothetical protein